MESDIKNDLRIVLELAEQGKIQDHQVDDDLSELGKEKDKQEQAIANIRYNYDL